MSRFLKDHHVLASRAETCCEFVSNQRQCTVVVLQGEAEAERIKELLKELEHSMAEGQALQAGGDHRMSASKKDSKTPGAQIHRQQVEPCHNSRHLAVWCPAFI